MTARFFIETSDAPHRPLPWPEDLRSVTIGRTEDNFLQAHDDQSSRRHVRITRRFGRYTLRDLNSLNGTQVDGKAVTKTTLCNGSRIRIGNTIIRFSVDVETCEPSASGLLDGLPDSRTSILCVVSVAASLLGLFLWYMAAGALVLGAFAALNVKLRPKLRGMWIGVLGTALGGAGLVFHFVGGGVAPAWQAWDSAQLQIECRKRLKLVRDGLAQYQTESSGRGPASLAELHPKYVDTVDVLYCPAAEKLFGKHDPQAAYAYDRSHVSLSRSDQWVVRDPDIEGHGEGGAVLYSGGQIRWLARHEFVELLARDLKRGIAE